MPAGLKRASSAFLDSPVKPGNDRGWDGDVVIIMRPLLTVTERTIKKGSLTHNGCYPKLGPRRKVNYESAIKKRIH